MYLYGASGHAKVIIDIAEANQITIEGLYDDNKDLVELLGYPIKSPLRITTDVDLLVSIGNNKIRKKVVKSLSAKFTSLIHPSAIISARCKIGLGTVVMQGAILQADVIIGNHSIINTGASVDHECLIDDFVHISPKSTLCGNVSIGEGTWIGAGTTILPGVKVGKWCTIGAGSVVAKNIPDFSLAVGNRCKIIKTLK